MPIGLGDIVGQIGTGDYRLVKGKDVDITAATALSTLENADIFLVDEGAAGTQASTKKITADNIWSYIQGKAGSGNGGLVPSAGSAGQFLAHDGSFAQVDYGNLSNTPTIPSIANATNNRVLTSTGGTGINAESGLTFTGDTLDLEANIAQIIIHRTGNDGVAPFLTFLKDRGAAGVDDDDIAKLQFKSFDDKSTPEETIYAMIVASISDATEGEESGNLELNVTSHGVGGQVGLLLKGDTNVANTVDVDIAKGTSSTTTVAGDLQINGNDIKDNDGTTCITFDSNGNTTIQNDLTVGAQEDGDATLIISADTDNGNGEEGDNARLWFKQDGDITEGAIQMSSNVLNIINNISGAGGISFQTGTTNNTGTTDPATGATERMSIASNGQVSVAGNLSSNTLGVTQGINSDSLLASKVTARIRENFIPTAATVSSGLCEIITQGSVYGGGSLTPGKVYQLVPDATNNANMSWKATNATNTSSSSGLLAVALSTSPNNGMLLRGVVVIESTLLSSVSPGDTLYLRTADGGIIQTPPNSSGNCQRIIGHFLKTTATDGDRMIHFNPSQEFITLA